MAGRTSHHLHHLRLMTRGWNEMMQHFFITIEDSCSSMRSNNSIVACTCMALLLHCGPALGWSLAKPKGASITTTKSVEKQPDPQRRAIFSAPIILALSSTLFITDPAHAFDNGVPEYANYVDKPKRRGTPPKDLGVLPRTTEGEDDQLTLPALRTCDGNPNCFSTTGDFLLSDR